MSIDRLTIIQPDDWHVHLRDGEILSAVASITARVFGRAIVMPNLHPPITSVDQALKYRQRIMNAVPPGIAFTPLMTAYLTDEISPKVLEAGFLQGVFTAAKLYPANSTTNSNDGVTDIRAINSLWETMERIGMPLLIHGEINDIEVDIFDREKIFIERYLEPLIRDFPDLRVVLEHITTEEAVQFVEASHSKLGATITPHHLHINRNAIFNGGLRSDFYCLPVAKREHHRLALRRAATSGKSSFFLGTDSAPHVRSAKENACGCAGIFNALHALESYAEVFEEEGAIDKLESFASKNGADFYGLSLNTKTISLIKTRHLVRDTIEIRNPRGDLVEQLVPFHAGDYLTWMVELE